ncbi:MAG: PLP-dependent aminotransferase family protein [Clostridium sp.]
MFKDLRITEDEVVYCQITRYIKNIIDNGLTIKGTKLPSTRELGKILGVGRNSVIQAYEELINEGYIETSKGIGTFVIKEGIKGEVFWDVEWGSKKNKYADLAVELDIVKNEPTWERGMISFKSIAPLGELFDLEEVKKAFHNRIAVEEDKILNYGYAKGYRPLINFLFSYMKNKGMENNKKDILVTNGFTEAFDMILASFTVEGDYILCENPTHNTAIKIMKTYGLNIIGIPISKDGIDIDALKEYVKKYNIKFAYLTPSYHNPTGVVTPLNKRIEIYNVLKESEVPIIEDGFNEELFYESSHIASLASLEGSGKGVIYIGSFSKVLFPGMRIGWIYGDSKIIDILESVKRCRNIHTSFLDQALLYDYLSSGAFEKYIKKIRRIYKDKYEFTVNCINKYIRNAEVWSKGGLYVYITINGVNSRELLKKCYERGVLIMDSSIFEINGQIGNSIRLGFTRLEKEDIEKGLIIIGNSIEENN